MTEASKQQLWFNLFTLYASFAAFVLVIAKSVPVRAVCAFLIVHGSLSAIFRGMVIVYTARLMRERRRDQESE